MRNLGAFCLEIVASQAQALNVGGDVVGRSGAADFSVSRAVIWQDGVAIDLNRLIAIARLDSFERDGDQRSRIRLSALVCATVSPGLSSESAVAKNRTIYDLVIVDLRLGDRRR